MRTRIWIVLWLVCLLPAVVWAEPITLQWDAVTVNTDQTPLTDLCCYILYWGTSTGVYPNSVNVGNVTKYTLGGLNPATNYYFVIRARDTTGNESPASVERSGRPRRVITF